MAKGNIQISLTDSWIYVDYVVHGLLLATFTDSSLGKATSVYIWKTTVLFCPEVIKQTMCQTRHVEPWMMDSRVTQWA